MRPRRGGTPAIPRRPGAKTKRSRREMFRGPFCRIYPETRGGTVEEFIESGETPDHEKEQIDRQQRRVAGERGRKRFQSMFEWNVWWELHQKEVPNAKCQMPNAKCQMPNAKCQMPIAVMRQSAIDIRQSE